MARVTVATKTIASTSDVGVWFFQSLVDYPGLPSIVFGPSVSVPDTVGSYGWAGSYYVVGSDLYLGRAQRIQSFALIPCYLYDDKTINVIGGGLVQRGIYFRTEYYGYPGTFTIYADSALEAV